MRLNKPAIIIILLLAASLRLYQLPTLPPGLNFDEAGNGVAALDILQGVPRLWWQIGGGKEPLWPWLIAAATAMLGNIPLSLRLPAALTGIVTVAAVYPLTVKMFRTDLPRQARLIALLTMLGLALSGWHLHFSRLGFRAILLPLLSTLGFYFFWQGMLQCPASGLTNRPAARPIFVNLILTALFLALAIYAYLAARLLPLIPMFFGSLYWLTKKHRTHARCFRLFYANLIFLTLIFLIPLGLYFWGNPADLLARTGTVSIFNPDWNQGDLPGTAWRTLTATLGTFMSGRGDANPLVNMPGTPILPLWLAPFFLLGLLTSLTHTLHRRPVTPSPYLFLLLWWLVTLLPAVLAPEGAPHHLRLIGAIVPTYMLLAIGLTTTANFIAAKLPHPGPKMMAVGYLLMLLPQTFIGYFIRWPAATDFTLPFDQYAVRLAADIAAAPPDTAYVLPMDIRAGREARHYTLDYLLAHHQENYQYTLVDERNAEIGLQQAAQNHTELRVIRWTDDKHRAADEKEIVTFLLETNARHTEQQSFPVYNIETYVPAPFHPFTLPPIDRPIGADFDGLLRLDAVYLPAVAFPGDWLPVAITLAPLSPLEVDYKISLRLITPAGERITQKDRVLRHNFHQGTSLWPPETVNEYYLLPIPPEAVSGNYTVSAVIYHPDTLAPLIAAGQAELPLGQVRID